MSREDEFTHEGFVYANNIYMERKCELFEVKDIAHDFVQGAIYADQHPREGLWDAEKVKEWLRENIYNRVYECGDRLAFPTADFLNALEKAMEE